MAGAFYKFFTRTNVGDAGAGVLDRGFVYPWLKPAQYDSGPGNVNQQILAICQGNPVYYRLAVSNAPAQGPGNVNLGTIGGTELLPNFYNPSENTAFF